ncbi:hypothetical protein Q6348_10575 [Isoptericola sp. b441]|uniref:Uncharacterized protein n=1 Tax=Actinotalea lenta TaxID=3064654 RepID=A0ABT9D9S6_9CELL|nr:hypothetical protein [Isoptericola sp. b441]MDO8107640.1 hypothetical protein [Isoptericola sp. b441]
MPAERWWPEPDPRDDADALLRELMDERIRTRDQVRRDACGAAIELILDSGMRRTGPESLRTPGPVAKM